MNCGNGQRQVKRLIRHWGPTRESWTAGPACRRPALGSRTLFALHGHLLIAYVTTSMRYPSGSAVVQQQCLEEADFDLDLLQSRVDGLRKSLAVACQEFGTVLSRISGLNIQDDEVVDVRQRALEMSATCRAACAHLDVLAGSKR